MKIIAKKGWSYTVYKIIWKNMKILINGLTIEDGNIVPLLVKVKYWQSIGCLISIFGNKCLKEKIENLGIIGPYEFIELSNTKKIKNKYQLIKEALKRNITALKKINLFKGYDIIYSVSSVLDLVILPWIIKKINKKVKWVTIFLTSGHSPILGI